MASDADQNILVCLSSAPSNEKIIRVAADMARAYGAKLTALFVETGDFADASDDNKERLSAHMELARQLGAEVETAFGDDIAYQIAKFSEMAGVTKIVLGRSTFTKRRVFWRPNLVEQLLAYAPDIDVHIIPDKAADVNYYPAKSKKNVAAELVKDILIIIAVLGVATGFCYLFHSLGFEDANLIMLYILAVIIISVATSNLIYSLIASIGSVFLFNYLFTVPRFSLSAYDTGYPITFLVMFLTAFITGYLARRYKRQATLSAKIAGRLKMLFDTNRLLSAAVGKDEIIKTMASQIIKMFGADVMVFDDEGAPLYFPANESKQCVYDTEIERSSAECAIKGVIPPKDGKARFNYMPLKINNRVYGAVGIDAYLSALESDSMMTVLLEAALALENERNTREKEEAAVFARTEQLRANILRSLSHDLRTPLTSISGNISNLIENEDKFDSEARVSIYRDIRDDADWLISLVENLLASTRIEDGKLQLKLADELIGDIIEDAYTHIAKKVKGHNIILNTLSEPVFVRVDAKLISQVIVNLVDNAVKYTPEGSTITLGAEYDGDVVRVSVTDDGYGVSEEDKPHIFDMFYCGNNRAGDSRRSLGLGLYLSRSIVEAHGGRIFLTDNVPHGAVFGFELKGREVQIDE